MWETFHERFSSHRRAHVPTLLSMTGDIVAWDDHRSRRGDTERQPRRHHPPCRGEDRDHCITSWRHLRAAFHRRGDRHPDCEFLPVTGSVAIPKRSVDGLRGIVTEHTHADAWGRVPSVAVAVTRRWPGTATRTGKARCRHRVREHAHDRPSGAGAFAVEGPARRPREPGDRLTYLGRIPACLTLG